MNGRGTTCITIDAYFPIFSPMDEIPQEFGITGVIRLREFGPKAN
jgi:hypothetical protein